VHGRQRAFLLGAALLLAAAVPAGAGAVQHVEVRIAARKVVEPADGRLVLRQGDAVVIDWTVDEAVELHVHGYDLAVRAAPGRPASTSFTARATGRFPVSSHGFGGTTGHERALLYIEVQPPE
jgi:hypothetical protein